MNWNRNAFRACVVDFADSLVDWFEGCEIEIDTTSELPEDWEAYVKTQPDPWGLQWEWPLRIEGDELHINLDDAGSLYADFEGAMQYLAGAAIYRLRKYQPD